MVRARLAAGVLGVAALVSAAACSGNEAETSVAVDETTTTAAPGSDPAATPGGKLTIGVESAPESLDPMFGNGGSGTSAIAMAQDALYDEMAVRDADGSLQPSVAESWEPNEDLTVWTAKITPGITFSDGTALDAAAVAANYTFRADPANCRCATKWAEIAVAATDSTTVTFTTKAPNAHLPETDFGEALVAPSTLVPGADRDRAPIGSGPFTLTDRDSLSFTKNADYWRSDDNGQQLPYLDELQLAPIPDPTVRIAALTRGEIDLMEVQDGPTLAQAEDDDAFTVDRAAGGTTLVIANTSRPAMKNPKVREALSLAVDREALAQSYLPGAFDPAYSFFTSGTSIQVTGEYPKHDMAKAQALVAEIKAENTELATLKIVCAKLPEAEALIEVAKNQISEAGFAATLSMLDVGEYAAQVLGGGSDWDIACTRFPSLGGDPAALANFLVTGRAANVARYSNPEVDALFEQDRTATDPTQRTEIYQKVSDALVRDLPYVPLLTSSIGTVASATARGVTTIDLDWPTKPDTEMLWRAEN